MKREDRSTEKESHDSRSKAEDTEMSTEEGSQKESLEKYESSFVAV